MRIARREPRDHRYLCALIPRQKTQPRSDPTLRRELDEARQEHREQQRHGGDQSDHGQYLDYVNVTQLMNGSRAEADDGARDQKDRMEEVD